MSILTGIGSAAPPHRIDAPGTIELLTRACGASGDDARRIESIVEGSRVASRASVLLDARSHQAFFAGERTPSTGERMRVYHAHAGELALRAARAALADAGASPDSITHLVTVSCTGFGAPGVDTGLIAGLGLRATTPRTNVAFMGCHGAVNGLRVADAIARAHPGSRVLLCCVELCSLHLHMDPSPDQMVANALFADGSAALIVEAAPDARTFAQNSSLANPRLVARVRETGSLLLPQHEGLMSWNIGDLGFEMRLSARLPSVLRQHAGPWVRAWLSERGVHVEDVRSWAIHPGGPRVLDAIGESLGLPDEALAPSRGVLRDHGNMSSATVLFVLERLRSAGASVPTPAVMLSFGPGLGAEIALLA